jgi:hypothetical protein
MAMSASAERQPVAVLQPYNNREISNILPSLAALGQANIATNKTKQQQQHAVRDFVAARDMKETEPLIAETKKGLPTQT